MANPILAVTPLSCNDIRCLSQLFESSFDYHSRYSALLNNTCLRDYLEDIRTVVGLGFTATLVFDELVFEYRNYLNIFLRYQYFKARPSRHSQLALSIANMVNTGSDAFQWREHLPYYESFVAALKRCVYHIVEEIGIKPPDSAENVLKILEVGD